MWDQAICVFRTKDAYHGRGGILRCNLSMSFSQRRRRDRRRTQCRAFPVRTSSSHPPAAQSTSPHWPGPGHPPESWVSGRHLGIPTSSFLVPLRVSAQNRGPSDSPRGSRWTWGVVREAQNHPHLTCFPQSGDTQEQHTSKWVPSDTRRASGTQPLLLTRIHPWG